MDNCTCPDHILRLEQVENEMLKIFCRRNNNVLRQLCTRGVQKIYLSGAAETAWVERYLSKKTISKMQNIRAVLVDLSGTLHIEDTAVPGAQAALERQAS